ncbi:MAG: DUF5615 family PIN-like protein [Spirochaetales bacterium]
MTLWLDAQLPPSLAVWFREQFGVAAYSMKHLGLNEAADLEIFQRAKAESVFFRVGNSTNSYLRELLNRKWPEIRLFLDQGLALVTVGRG